ncbi:head-tail adaptor protein [Jhaorihella thermophila]
MRAPDGAGAFPKHGRRWARSGPRSRRARAGNGARRGCRCPPWSIGSSCAPRPWGASMRPEAGQRFRDGARIFAIRAVAERDPDGRFLICFCDEEVAA